jgi:hypothetical protein
MSKHQDLKSPVSVVVPEQRFGKFELQYQEYTEVDASIGLTEGHVVGFSDVTRSNFVIFLG